MLDSRLVTFMELCKTLNYTKTAEHLHLTQPAVTQHIQYLERHYGVKLFQYSKKQLSLTDQGKLLESRIRTLNSDSKRLKREICAIPEKEGDYICFGATPTIGEYIMPDILASFLTDHPEYRITMKVGNTKELLSMLDQGELDFALIEGFFNKEEYAWKTFVEEKFIGVCSPHSELASGKYHLEEVYRKPLLLREPGSGAREILEQVLTEHNLSADNLSYTEIGNINVIKELTGKNLGATFLYKAAAKKELAEGKLSRIKITDLQASREFHFVYLKDSIYGKRNLAFYQYCRKALK
ncbi:LysR family transcriptional regulator [Anaerolentibacter hominis]|uniref:LysR family transcriptional regulator n=1 Tax=Anaerolentibacter hominis TaxID=3079009 RepID=UPI0031B8A576